MKLTKKDLAHEIKAYLLITFGLLIYTFAVTAFLAPHHLVGGGVTGIATIIYFLTGNTIPIGYSYFIINFILIAIAMKVIGPKFGVKTIYAIFMSSFLLSIFQNFIHEPLLDDKFMCAVLSGIMCGAGIGISLANGGSTAGTDIVAMMINKYHNISPGKIIMYIDVVIIGCSYFTADSTIADPIVGVGTIIYGYGVWFPPIALGPMFFAFLCGVGAKYFHGGRQSTRNLVLMVTTVVVAGIINSFVIGLVTTTWYQMIVVGKEGAFTVLAWANFLSRLASKPAVIALNTLVVFLIDRAAYRPVVSRIVPRPQA